MAYQLTPSAYANPSGLRLLHALEAAGHEIFTLDQAIETGQTLDLTRRSVDTVIQSLTNAGWVTRVKRGLYAINDPLTHQPKAHPFAVGVAIASPSAISHWSALQHWGLTEQIPGVITLSSPMHTYPPRHQSARIGARPAWVVAGLPYEYIAVPSKRFFGVTRVWVTSRDHVPIFSKERTLLDMFHHFHVFGSMSVAVSTVEEHIQEIDVGQLVQYALELGIAAVIKRVGWTLQEFGAPATQLAPLQSYSAKEESPLDPRRPARGRHNAIWRVIENLDAHE